HLRHGEHRATQNIAAGVQGNTAFTQANQAVFSGTLRQISCSTVRLLGTLRRASNNILFNQNAGVNQASTGAIGNNLAVNQGNTVAFQGNQAVNQANTGSILGNVAALGQQNTVNALGNACDQPAEHVWHWIEHCGHSSERNQRCWECWCQPAVDWCVDCWKRCGTAQSNGMNFVSNLGAVQGFQVDVSKNVVA
ncbi:hypothetical protein BC829DRAFT_382101, partial [Chytridium lagenaria]